MAQGQKGIDKLVRRLKKLSEAESAPSLNEKKAERCLAQLQSMRLTVEQLQRSSLGAIVNRLRKLLKSEAALKISRDLIKDWRLAVADAKRAAADGQAEGPATSSESEAGHSGSCRHDGGATAAASAENTAEESPTTDDAAAAAESADLPPATGDPMRDKCREMLQQALEQIPPGGDAIISASRLAADIEAGVFAEFGSSADSKYRTRIRSRVMNLRDPKNPGLRDCLLRGALGAADFARMTSEQMASDEMKLLRQRLTKEAIRVHQVAAAPTQASEGSSLFTCKRCRKKNCTYNQLQTLSGDEPMTTYVLCNECGFRWKFN